MDFHEFADIFGSLQACEPLTHDEAVLVMQQRCSERHADNIRRLALCVPVILVSNVNRILMGCFGPINMYSLY